MFISTDGKPYFGDMVPGDRAATADEIAAYQASRIPTFAALKAIELAKFRSDREAYLNRIAGIGFAAMVAGDTAKAQLISAVRQGLLDLPSNESVVSATDIVTLKNAMRMAYLMLVVPLPEDIKAAFVSVDK